MTTNNSVGKEEMPAGNQIFSIYKNMPDCPLKKFLSQWFDKYDDQPIPLSAKGVEEKKVDKNSMRLILKKHQVLEIIDDSFVHGTFPIEFIIAAMTEYSSLMNKEKDREIKQLNLDNEVLTQTLKVAKSSLEIAIGLKEDYKKQLYKLQQLLSEKEKEIEYYKQLAEAAELTISGFKKWSGGARIDSIDEMRKDINTPYEKYQSLKQKKP